MTLVAVAPSKFAKGVESFEDDWTLENPRKVRPVYEQLELADALARTYRTDAHLVTYIVRDPHGYPIGKQPRINKTGLTVLLERNYTVELQAFFCDVDNPDHAPWTDALREEALAQHAGHEVLATAGVYFTQHGRRIVQPLTTPIPVTEAEPHIRQWLLSLERAGIPVDWHCRDWTRHFRLPHVRRSLMPYRSPHVDIERMQPIELPPLKPEELVLTAPAGTVAASSPIPAAPLPTLDWTGDLPELWAARVPPIAAAVRTVTSSWHDLFLALGGALLTRGLPPEHLPAMLRAISISTGADTRTSDRETIGRTTAARRAAGLYVAGLRVLRDTYPDVAVALEEALVTFAEARLREQEASTTAPMALADAVRSLEDTLRCAPEGLTVISAECGLGKTRAAQQVAIERAKKPYADPRAEHKRAPAQSKTSISVDKNILAIQVMADLRAQGVTVRRVFGPLSVIGEDGKPVCQYAEAAAHLVAGGQSMRWELCEGRGKEKCSYFEACTARDGAEGPTDARITVGPHALLGELDAAAGTTGLLVIDEPPPLLETVFLVAGDIDAALGVIGSFDRRFGAAMRPALQAFRGWLTSVAELDEVTDARSVVRHATADHVDFMALERAIDETEIERTEDSAEDVLACVAAAHYPRKRVKSSAPPILRSQVVQAKHSPAFAQQLGAASRVLRVIHHALTTDAPVSVRVEERKDVRCLLITAPNEELVRALRRDGSVVVTDANAALHLPVLTRVVGYDPPYHQFAAVDGAHIERTLLRTTSATRRGWMAHDKLVLDAGVVTAVRAVVDWFLEEPTARTLGIVTMRVLRLAIEATLEPDNKELATAWTRAGQRAADLPQARALLAPELARLPTRPLLAHYGATRGMNNMKDVDALATIGDPWPSLGDVRNDAAYLELEAEWEARYEQMCRAELEQAHGRLRAVHRTRPGRALHVGAVLPGGSGWASGVKLRQPAMGRPANTAGMSVEEVQRIVGKLGGVREAARLLSCGKSTVARYASGARAVPPAVALELRRLVGVSGTPVSAIAPSSDREVSPKVLTKEYIDRTFGDTCQTAWNPSGYSSFGDSPAIGVSGTPAELTAGEVSR